VQEGLIKIDRAGKMVPWLAERWYTTDSKNYTFFLRKSVRFHNGREMKAADVKFALDRAVNPETKHPYRTQYDAIQDVIVKDDYTVTVTLKKVDATFLYTMARQGSVIYPREAVETLKSQPMGTGPFTVAEWVRNDRIVLAKNKDYWVKGLPTPRSPPSRPGTSTSPPSASGPRAWTSSRRTRASRSSWAIPPTT